MFEKGIGGNPNGRPKGSLNFASLEKKQLINFLKDEGAEKFIRELMTLEGKDFCQAYIPVIEIAFPKLSRVETRVDQNVTFTQFEKHNDSELEAEISRLSNSLSGEKQTQSA